MWTFLLLACRSPLPPPPEPVAVPPATRWVESAAGIVLEVATDHYEHPDGREVTVMGSVHVAEQAFYDVSVARLKASQVVLYEGLIDDEGASSSEPLRVAAAYGLASQTDVPVNHPGWRHADLHASQLREAMEAAGVSEVAIGDLMGRPDDPPPDPLDVPRAGTGRALARLALVKQLAEPPSSDALYQRWLLQERNEHVLREVGGLSSVGLWYGADHLPGLGEGLQRLGYEVDDRTWTPALIVGFQELKLGPTQVKMLMKRGT